MTRLRVTREGGGTLTPAQQAFIDAAESLGATTPAAARMLAELPRVPNREIDQLVESGVVREAGDRRYYVYRSQDAERTPVAAPSRSWMPADSTPKRLARTILFWLLLVLIPILLLQLMGR